MKWKRKDKVIEEPINDYLEKIFIEESDKNHILNVCVGTDSQKTGKSYKFATVILISVSEDLGGGVIVGRGGKVIYKTFSHEFNTVAKKLVNERMMFEVSKSIETAYEISDILGLYDIHLEIHADINPDEKHESNKALQQAVGYILGMGYDFKIKPNAPASSNCADKLC